MIITHSILKLLSILSVLAGNLFPSYAGESVNVGNPLSSSARQVISVLQPREMATFIITLHDQLAYPIRGNSITNPLQAAAALPTKAARQKAVIEMLQAFSAQSQAGLHSVVDMLEVQGQARNEIPFWIFNGISLQATSSAIQVLAGLPEVASIVPDPDPNNQIIPARDFPSYLTDLNFHNLPAWLINRKNLIAPTITIPEPNISLVNAPALWAKGYTGQGVVVANLDTGVDFNHPDLIARYRGGTNSWYDPYNQNATPFDSSGHGTETMGIMVGGGDPAAATSIGMAPGARWIAAKIFDNKNMATITAIHQAFQWVMNPNNNLADTGAPDIVNNSWTNTAPGCDLTFQSDITALWSAGIIPIFSGGNDGPGSATDPGPANNTDAFPVGAVDNSGSIASFSSQGPNSCNAILPFPDIVAPGVNIKTSFSDNGYIINSGTSFSAPHVSGALALLLSAMPYLSVDLQKQALIQGAVPLGSSNPNSTFGYGRLDVLASFEWLNTPLAIPAGLVATNISINQNSLVWSDTNAGAAAYEIERSTDRISWIPIATTPAGANNYSDIANLVPDTLYYYRVRAFNNRTGATSQYAGTNVVVMANILKAPSNLTATTASPNRINLNWTNSSTLATTISLERSPAGLSAWALLASLSSKDTSYVDSSGLSEGTSYSYRLKALNNSLGLGSTYTNASATTLLLAPTDLIATPVLNTEIDLHWTNHSLIASGVELQRSSDGQVGWTTIFLGGAGTNLNSYNDNASITPGKFFYYRVRATSAVVNSDFSSVIHAHTSSKLVFLPLVHK